MRNYIHAVYYWANAFTWIRPIIWANTQRDVEGIENVPRRGPLILASNHLSLTDPAILIALMPRRIAWMGKRELFDIPFFGSWYRLFGVVPVRRFEADLAALHKAQEALRRGLALGMFPEGTRSLSGGLQKGYGGTALIALRTGAPVLPVALWGSEVITLPQGFFRRTPVHVRFGQPFFLPQVERIRTPVVEEGTALIMRQIAALLPSQYRGVYAHVIASQGIAPDVRAS